MIDHWIEKPTTKEEEEELHLQRLYGKKVYFGNDLMEKYKILQQARGVTRIKEIPTPSQLEVIIPELEKQYLFQKIVVEHPY
jgi:hypothetical protein